MRILRYTVLRTLMCLLIILGLCGCGSTPDKSGEAGAQGQGDTFQRIVSLSPNITETLYALGLGDKVVGVTRFCTYPPEATKKPQVGGYLDPNYEMIATLTPDLVLLLPEQDAARLYLDQLGIHHETLHNRTIDDIIGTIDTIGDLCGVAARADSISTDISQRIAYVREHAPSNLHPKVMVSISRTFGTGSLKDIFIAGRGTHYDELIEIAGGVNAYQGEIAYPSISMEGLLHLDPDIIIDIIPDYDSQQFRLDNIRAEWNQAEHVNAVETSSIYVFTEDYPAVPGPRFIQFLEDISACIQKKAMAQ